MGNNLSVDLDLLLESFGSLITRVTNYSDDLIKIQEGYNQKISSVNLNDSVAINATEFINTLNNTLTYFDEVKTNISKFKEVGSELNPIVATYLGVSTVYSQLLTYMSEEIDVNDPKLKNNPELIDVIAACNVTIISDAYTSLGIVKTANNVLDYGGGIIDYLVKIGIPADKVEILAKISVSETLAAAMKSGYEDLKNPGFMGKIGIAMAVMVALWENGNEYENDGNLDNMITGSLTDITGIPVSLVVGSGVAWTTATALTAALGLSETPVGIVLFALVVGTIATQKVQELWHNTLEQPISDGWDYLTDQLDGWYEWNFGG